MSAYQFFESLHLPALRLGDQLRVCVLGDVSTCRGIRVVAAPEGFTLLFSKVDGGLKVWFNSETHLERVREII